MWGNLGDTPTVGKQPEGAGDMSEMDGHARILQCLHRSMEEMLFMPVDAQDVVWADIPVQQPVSGKIGLVISIDKAAEIASTMFGDAVMPEDPRVDDAMAELINTISGHIMLKFTSDGQEFALGLPSVLKTARCAFDEPMMVYFLNLGGACFQLVLMGAELVALVQNR